MKRFNWKFAAIFFFGVIGVDLVLEFLSLMGPGRESWWDWLVGVPAWIINLPGLPLVPYLRNSSDGTTILFLVVSICLGSAVVWSVLAGFILRRKYAA